jgi:hypothetical protein
MFKRNPEMRKSNNAKKETMRKKAILRNATNTKCNNAVYQPLFVNFVPSNCILIKVDIYNCYLVLF